MQWLRDLTKSYWASDTLFVLGVPLRRLWTNEGIFSASASDIEFNRFEGLEKRSVWTEQRGFPRVQKAAFKDVLLVLSDFFDRLIFINTSIRSNYG